MLYIFGFIFSALLVVGQTFYKYASERAAFEPTAAFIFSRKMLDFLLSWQFLAGLSAFIIASLISFWMLTRFQFSSIQAVTVPVVMALSYIVGAWLFKDTITPLNMLGLVVLLVGVILASIK
jgi:multidrug transporter EmrE-like cation transporter